ncbi:hypothetical protein FB45DRAFT_871385 [Roridomyces roridus]|uniref:Zn(2)-C6 fungal-type domain-containing protein n=1 Tax=Roridomyces roridus TaxID=1738132 RepID=A0AAD7BGU9_9AGAR|nr:hypothetical protein FB45DRAFT_871385 [Roridomyces roridus]
MSQQGLPGANARAFLPVLRKRVYVACTNCRRLKIRCDTTEEALDTPCERCARRGLQCQYLTVNEERSVSPTTPKHGRAPPSPPEPYQPYSSQHDKYPQQYDILPGGGVPLHDPGSKQNVPPIPQYQYHPAAQGQRQPEFYPDEYPAPAPPAAGHYTSPPVQQVPPGISGQYYEQAYAQTGYLQYGLGGNTTGYAANGRASDGLWLGI